MKNLFKISAVLVLFLTASCFMDGVKGNRNVVTQDRKISSDFDAITVSHGIEVRLTMSDATSLSLEADENLHDIIITEAEDGVLRIYSEENIWSAKARKVYLTAENINKIKATSGSEVISENTISAGDFDIRVSSGADVRLMLDVGNLSCNTSSGSDARLKGNAGHFIASSSSGSNIRAKELTTKTCNAAVSSGADISVNVTDKLNAAASSGGGIRYSGNPTEVKKSSSSGGSIRG
ncbi:head GIN domain-containing protein [Aureibaculum sp. 2210JD6-5]|uniref:head GIN domain-containing protein n=1 Tax=Aureibaculum sp. 2210JD6-5 TaxID=3103957 RepID=UPI002AAE3A0B|nr:head GIN domain-containing protein [Aureibaculum sp. 2210JD6-5]MDY7396564.1 head GIN domain-containing protein [Aureibaculum sp. 2210JD6-5]